MFFLKADGYINQKTGEVVHDLYTVEAPASHDRYYKSSYFGSNFIWVTLCACSSSSKSLQPSSQS